MFKFPYIPVRDGSGPLLFPPSKIHPGSLPARASFPYPLFFLPFCLLSVHISVFSRPPPAASGHSSSVRRKATNPPAATDDQCPLLVSCAAAHMQACTPPPTCAAGGTWLGCGRRGEGDGAPRDGLESLNASAGVAWVTGPCRRSSSLFDYCGARLSVSPPPPSPFPVQLYLSLHSPS